MNQPGLDPQLKERIEQWAKERAARDQASIKFGFGALIVVVIGVAIWFIVWWINPDQVSKVLVEMRARGVRLPESRLTYPIDGAPVLEEQWGWGKTPGSPFRDSYTLDAIVVDKLGESVFIVCEESDHRDLVIAADEETQWSAVHRAVASLPGVGERLLWLAVRTPATVGEKNAEVRLEGYERSELGVVPVALRNVGSALEDCPAHFVPTPVGADAAFGSVVKMAERLYTPGKSVCMFPMEGSAPAGVRPSPEEK